MKCPRCDSELETTNTEVKSDTDDFDDYIDVSFRCTSKFPHRYFTRIRKEDLLEDD